MEACSFHCTFKFKYTSKFQCCVDKEEVQVKVSKVSRRQVINLVGFNSVLLHVCPAHAAPAIGYTGPDGPEKWGSLSPSFSACSSGKGQSPIEIKRNDAVFSPYLGLLRTLYFDSNATLINNGYNVELEFGNEVGGAFIDGKQSSLKQMHWHSPSEHTIDGVRYAAELHMVHKYGDGSISVVAILYKLGAPDAFLSQIKDQFDQLAQEASAGHEGSHIPIEVVKAADILQTTNRYFRYVGSLTTPPCSEQVIWNVLEEVREISIEQVNALKAPLEGSCKNNFRPTQPTNGRLVEISAASKTSNLFL